MLRCSPLCNALQAPCILLLNIMIERHPQSMAGDSVFIPREVFSFLMVKMECIEGHSRAIFAAVFETHVWSFRILFVITPWNFSSFWMKVSSSQHHTEWRGSQNFQLVKLDLGCLEEQKKKKSSPGFLDTFLNHADGREVRSPEVPKVLAVLNSLTGKPHTQVSP